MSDGPPPALLQTVERYYTERLRTFGTTARGVDWNDEESQQLRFDRLLQILGGESPDDVLLDLGCGYGALLETIRGRGLGLAYRGVDLSPDMIAAARSRHAADARATFSEDAAHLGSATYAIASGIFNVKLQHGTPVWHDYVLTTLQALHAASRRGFAFNMLSTYSDVERRKDTLYYADPREIFDVCKQRFSPQVALLHDYPLYEFTVLVRK